MPPKRISTTAASVAAVVVVALIGVLLYSMRSPGSAGTQTFQQRLLQLGGTQLVLARSSASATTTPISADIPIIEKRLASLIHSSETLVMADSTADQVIVDIAGRPAGLDSVASLLTTIGQVNFIDTGSTALYIGTDVTGQTCTTTCASGQYKIVFTGAEFDPGSITAALDPSSNQPIVEFQFQGASQSAFATYTQNNIGNYLTITLDNKVIEAATIQSQITGVGEISGGIMTITYARNLASLLKSGALPVALRVISETTVQPGTPASTVVSCSTPTAATGTTVAQIRVPNVVGEEFDQAVLLIQQAGLQVVGVPQVDPQVPPGAVIKTSPPGGAMVPTTQVVTIYYSAVQPTTPPATPTPSPGKSGATSSTSNSQAAATPAGPEGACATPTPIPTASTQPMATPTASPMPFQTPIPTATPGAP